MLLITISCITNLNYSDDLLLLVSINNTNWITMSNVQSYLTTKSHSFSEQT